MINIDTYEKWCDSCVNKISKNDGLIDKIISSRITILGKLELRISAKVGGDPRISICGYAFLRASTNDLSFARWLSGIQYNILLYSVVNSCL